jgi:hypothetical protein
MRRTAVMGSARVAAHGPWHRAGAAWVAGAYRHVILGEEQMKQLGAGRFVLLVLVPLALVAGCDRQPSGPGDHTLGRVEIIDRGQTDRPVVALWTAEAGWTGGLPDVRLSTTNQRISLGARIFDLGGQERALVRDGEYSVRWALAPGAAAGILVVDDSRGERFHGDHIHIYGQAVGSTRIEFLLWHGDHADGATEPIEIRVVN